MKNTAIAEVQGIEAPLGLGALGTNPYTLRNYLAEKTGKRVEFEFTGDYSKHKDASAVIAVTTNDTNSFAGVFGGAHYVAGINNGNGTFRWYNEYEKITEDYGNNVSISDRAQAMADNNFGHLAIIAVYDKDTDTGTGAGKGGGFR